MLAEMSSLISQPLVEKSVTNFYHYAFWASSKKAERELGYRHRPLGETLSDAAAWYEAEYIRRRQEEPVDLAGE
jgi:nucleoside-diphosphate-sugar epimerase